MNTQADRVLTLLKARGVPDRRIKPLLAETCGIKYQSVQQWFSGETKTIQADHLAKIARRWNGSLDWLIDGKGQMDGGLNVMPVAPQRGATPVPIVGIAQGGNGEDGFWEAMDYPVGHGDGYIEWNTSDPNAYALEVRGDSMAPRIRHGEFVIAEPNAPVEPGEEVIVIGKNGKKMVKMLDYRRGGRVYLSSINKDHPQFSIDESEIEAIHASGGIAPRRARKP